MDFDDWLAGATGSYLLACDPLDAQAPFFRAVVARRPGDTLLVATARSAERVPPAVRAAVDETVDATPRTAAAATNVGSPSDLTGISMPVSSFLQDADAPLVLLDSVSPLLYHAEDVAVFRFLSVLAAQIARGDGLGIVTMVPAAHPAATFHTFEQVFDGHLDLDATADRVRIRPRGEGPDGPGDGPVDAPAGWQSF